MKFYKIRGGSYCDVTWFCLDARFNFGIDFCNRDVGFRLIKSLKV